MASTVGKSGVKALSEIKDDLCRYLRETETQPGDSVVRAITVAKPVTSAGRGFESPARACSRDAASPDRADRR